jgi:hypothetical protein
MRHGHQARKGRGQIGMLQGRQVWVWVVLRLGGGPPDLRASWQAGVQRCIQPAALDGMADGHGCIGKPAAQQALQCSRRMWLLPAATWLAAPGQCYAAHLHVG